MRGVHYVHIVGSDAVIGSSPHARGPLILIIIPLFLPGIIPACAGSTWPGADGRRDVQDHPRMRGVHPI